MRKMIMATAMAAVAGFGAQPLSAQTSGSEFRPQTLVGDVVTHGGFGGTAVRFGEIAGEGAVLTGGGAAWLVNHTTFVGVEGWGLASNNARVAATPGGAAKRLDMGYGGLSVGQIFRPASLVHVTTRVLVGAGGLGYGWKEGEIADKSDAFFVTEPAVGVELNVAPMIRLGVGGSYRAVRGVEMGGLRNKDLSGPTGEINVRFGRF